MDIAFEGSMFSLFGEEKESSEFLSSWADTMSEEPIAAEGDLESQQRFLRLCSSLSDILA